MEGRRPSNSVGITCEVCAFCLDEALVLRERAALRRQADKALEDQEQEAQMRELSDLHRYAREGM
jgi:hypothetical protein